MCLNELEKEYFNKYSPYNIEKSILETFSKEEFINFIKDFEFKIKQIDFIYNKRLSENLKSYKDFELKELDRFFIETHFYYFNWWEEIQELKESLSKIKFYYRLYHLEKNNNYKNFDIKSVPIEQVIWMYIKLPSNLNRNLKCPLHEDKTASFRIYKNTKSYFCFWCWKWWNIVNFISDIENITTKEAYKKIVNLYSN